MTKSSQLTFKIPVSGLMLVSACLSQDLRMPPHVPQNLRVPTGHTLHFYAQATGTQNYVCVPGPNGPTWKFLGPQATIQVALPSIDGKARQQIATHYLSANPSEQGTPRPTWQHSFDTSTIWAKAIETSNHPGFVASGAIPWLLLEVVGNQGGPMSGSALVPITYIQRLNTSGGVSPGSGCDATAYGSVSLVPYSTDYFFYRSEQP